MDECFIGDSPSIWISVKEDLPQVSYLESDDADFPYQSYPVLLFAPWPDLCCCVAYLVKNQDEESWNFGELSWELYNPGQGCHVIDIDFDVFTHWMPLPKFPI